MISFRQLLVTLLVIALVWGFYRLRQRIGALRARRTGRHAVTYRSTVRCPRCSVYLPQGDSSRPVCDHPDCPLSGT